ncbi:hypothetical protein Tco_1346461 [Tanacetum coccineum]
MHLLQTTRMALAKMVALVNSRRKEVAEQRAQERRDMPMTPAQLRQYMRTYVKNQGPAVYTTGWTMVQVETSHPDTASSKSLDKRIQRAIAFTRGLKRDGSPMTAAFSKKLKTGDVEVDVESPSYDVPQEVEVEAPSQDVTREKVNAPSHSQNIPEAQVEVHSQEATVEDVEVPSNIASKAQTNCRPHFKKVGTKGQRKKLLGRKGVQNFHLPFLIKEVEILSLNTNCAFCNICRIPALIRSINAIYKTRQLSQELPQALGKALHYGPLDAELDDRFMARNFDRIHLSEMMFGEEEERSGGARGIEKEEKKKGKGKRGSCA